MYKAVEKILLEFDPEIKNLLSALKKISASFEFVNEADALKVSEYFQIPLSKVFETASFYDLIKTEKQPSLVVQICSGGNCVVENSYKILKEIENYLGVKAGDEFSPKIKIEMVSCLGQCGEGPVVIINGNIYTKVSIYDVDKILSGYLR
jgi:NADH-quinone oxidoreductase subunit E